MVTVEITFKKFSPRLIKLYQNFIKRYQFLLPSLNKVYFALAQTPIGQESIPFEGQVKINESKVSVQFTSDISWQVICWMNDELPRAFYTKRDCESECNRWRHNAHSFSRDSIFCERECKKEYRVKVEKIGMNSAERHSIWALSPVQLESLRASRGVISETV